jgi:HD superfamily phosphohydrolase YqeK
MLRMNEIGIYIRIRDTYTYTAIRCHTHTQKCEKYAAAIVFIKIYLKVNESYLKVT